MEVEGVSGSFSFFKRFFASFFGQYLFLRPIITFFNVANADQTIIEILTAILRSDIMIRDQPILYLRIESSTKSVKASR